MLKEIAEDKDIKSKSDNDKACISNSISSEEKWGKFK